MLQKLTKSMSHNLMTLKRMGSRYPSRLSFSRSMLRTMLKEQWQISRIKFNLDHQGYGNAIYEVSTSKQSYSLICFSKHIDDNERNDRVIADTWDTAYVLHIGKISINDIKTKEPHKPSTPSIKLKAFVRPITQKTVNRTDKYPILIN